MVWIVLMGMELGGGFSKRVLAKTGEAIWRLEVMVGDVGMDEDGVAGLRRFWLLSRCVLFVPGVMCWGVGFLW